MSGDQCAWKNRDRRVSIAPLVYVNRLLRRYGDGHGGLIVHAGEGL